MRKSNRRLRRGLAAAATLLLMALALGIFVFRERLTREGLRSLIGGASGGAGGEAFTYETGTGQTFAPAGSGLAVVSSSAAELLDRAGETVFKQVVSFSAPAAFGSSKGALFCDLGGSGCILAGFDGTRTDIVPQGEILTAHMNENGWVALTTAAAGYKALVSVYDASGTLRYQWWSGGGYVLRACVSPDNALLAALCAETGGGRLRLFRLDSEEEAAAAAFPEELPFDLGFLDADRLCAVGDHAVFFLDTAGIVKNRFDLGSYYLLDYDLGGQGFAALTVSPSRTGAGGLLETLDRDGRLLGYTETGRDVLSLSACGRQLLTMTAGGLTVYDSDLKVRYSGEALMTAKKALLRPAGDILLLGSYSAERVKIP